MYEEYNIIGHGIVRNEFYENSAKLYEILKHYEFDKKLFEVRQLGSLRHFLKGAHYTKYEYMYIQNALLQQFQKNNKNSGLGSAYKSDYLKKHNIKMSRIEVLQCLSILTNAAHFPDTYNASKHWLQKLEYNSKNIRSVYRNALTSKQKELLDYIIKNNRYHEIHIMNMIFIIKTSKKRDTVLKFGQELLYDYLTKGNKELNNVLPYYETARKISYLTLDSHYAPIPIKINYQQVMSMFDKEFDKELILNKNSSFQRSLKQIAELLQNTVYLSSETLLHKKEIFMMLDQRFEENITEKIKSTSVIKELLHTQMKSKSNIYGVEDQSIRKNWNNNYIALEYKLTNKKSNNLLDLTKIEEDFTKIVGKQTGLFNIEFTPNHREVKIVCALYNNYNNKIRKAFDLVNEFINLNKKLNESGYELDDIDEHTLAQSLLKLILQFSFDKQESLQVNFDYENLQGEVFFIDNGKMQIIENILETIEANESKMHRNELYEIESTLEKIKEMNYKGLYIVYIGSTILRGKEGKKAEFDGVICTPNNSNHLICLIEAKYTRNSKSKAKKQLKRRLKCHLNKALNYNVESFKSRNAIATIKI